MNTMKWLIRREFWEHRGSLFWAPAIAGGVMVLFILATAIWAVASGHVAQAGMWVDGQQVDLATMLQSLPPHKRDAFVRALSSGYLATATPLFMMLSVVSFFYCLGALYEERRDRSILFWKSLPLSDRDTVLSKLATVLCLAPLLTLAVAIVTSLALLLIGATVMLFKGVNVFGLVLTNPGLYLTPFELVALLPVYVLWALPTVGYLLMVSSWARSKVFLWAVGVPLMIGAVLKWTHFLTGVGIDPKWYMENIVLRGLAGLVPGTWLALDDTASVLAHVGHERMVDMPTLLVESYKTLLSPYMWVGVAAGVAMIVAAIRLRRWRDEN
ncbi:MAG: ABC-2 transporter permease [Gammaproteobacteria bacterium]